MKGTIYRNGNEHRDARLNMELRRPSFETCRLIDESEVGRNCRLAYAVAEPMCFAPVAHPYTRNRSTEILARTCSPNVAIPFKR